MSCSHNPTVNSPDALTWIIAITGCVAAVAGGLGALAAWRAASNSADTSRDAAEALGIAIKPTIRVQHGIENGVTPILYITNGSAFDGKDVRVTIKMQDGSDVMAQAERLPAAVTLANQRADPPLRVVLPEPANSKTNHDIVGWIRVLHVLYSDDRRLCRYGYSWHVTTSQTETNGRLSYGRELTEADDRIDGPGMKGRRVG
jgi:hypothetical protein